MAEIGYPRIVRTADKGPEFDTGPAHVGGKRYANPPKVPSKIALRNRESGKVSEFFVVDSREILAQPNTLYERVQADDTSPPAAA
jgi:hypothetical protein